MSPDIIQFFFLFPAVLLTMFGLGLSVSQLFLQLKVANGRTNCWKFFRPVSREIRFSIHVPTYSEPPELVIATLRSVVAQQYGNFEVIVLDNNTVEEKLWRPVEEFCRDYPHLRFVHVASLSGFKAGALNLARTLTCPRARHIVTLDADYQLLPGALSQINACLQASDSPPALLQFPQAYRNAEGSGFLDEYGHFFDLYLNENSIRNEVLGTGTLTCIEVNALDRVGGWATDSITEDAALGLALRCEPDLHRRFCNLVIGQGLIPTDISTLFKQRQRWIYGNMQVVRNALAKDGRLRRAEWLQLTAWCNSLLPILVGQLLLLPILWTGSTMAGWLSMVSLAATVVVFLGKFWLFLGFVGRNYRWGVRAYLIHLNYLWLGAADWVGVLWNRKRPFVRTSKLGRASHWWQLPFVLPFSFLVFAVGCYLTGNLLTGIGYFLLTLLLLFSKWYFLHQVGQVNRTIVPVTRPESNNIYA